MPSAWLVLLAIAGSVGLPILVSTGKLFDPLRRVLARRRGSRWLAELLACSMCLGCWVGLGSGWASGFRGLAHLPWAGGTISLLSYATDLTLRRLEGEEDDAPPRS